MFYYYYAFCVTHFALRILRNHFANIMIYLFIHNFMKSFHYPCRYFIALTQTGRQDLPVQMQLKRLTTSHPTGNT